MNTINYLSSGEGFAGLNYSVRALDLKAPAADEGLAARIENLLIPYEHFNTLDGRAKALDFTARFKDVIQTFKVAEGEIPAGFRVESTLETDGMLKFDLVRDISYDKNGVKRPTGLIFSADSANPYEVEPIAPLLGNLTCNPGIVYDLFINNPKANIGGKYKTRDEVMQELGRILGPGCDVSVELNNPFEEDFEKILEEAERFKEILSEYRLVIKVPHTGPVNGENVRELLQGDKRFSHPYYSPDTKDALRGHNLALKLREHGFRINYTLMFEPFQTNLAMQVKPYFINSFVRHRAKQSKEMSRIINLFETYSEGGYLKELREYMLANDYLARDDIEHDLFDVLRMGKDILKYRNFDNSYGEDGLDGVRHNLRLLRNSNLRDTRLIICSMEGDYNYPDIDKLMADPEYADVIDRVVITAEPSYLARFTSANQVVSYQRRFMNAANGQA